MTVVHGRIEPPRPPPMHATAALAWRLREGAADRRHRPAVEVRRRLVHDRVAVCGATVREHVVVRLFTEVLELRAQGVVEIRIEMPEQRRVSAASAHIGAGACCIIGSASCCRSGR